MRTNRDAYSLGAAGLAEATTTGGAVKNTNALNYVINGRAYQKAATTDVAMVADASSAFVTLSAKKVSVFFAFLDTAGALTFVQSGVYDNAQAAGHVSRAIDWPDVPNKACIGAIKVETNNAATYTPNVTDLSAADVVDTFYNVADDYGVPVTI